MKIRSKYPKFLMVICSYIIFCSIILSACSSGDISKNDSSVAMIKNATMSTYGTGFAVGIPGKAVDTVITSYSIVATPNGAAPKTADIRINESEQNTVADVVFYDIGRNIAILKLTEPTKELKPMILEPSVDSSKTVFVRGYDGTGNIMSDFEKFNVTDIIQYSGNISTFDELNSIVVYKYSNEFNRALVGAPAMDESGNAIGMCAYSLNSMNTYSQYLLSSEEIIKLLSANEIDFMTTDEVMYKNIIISSISLGLLILVLIIVSPRLINKKERNLKNKDKYIIATDGALKGSIYKFDGKLSIGRDSSRCDIVYPVNEPGISALHCTIQREGKDCYLVDNFSSFGTFLEDGTRIESSFPYKIENKKLIFYIADPKNKFEFTDGKEL